MGTEATRWDLYLDGAALPGEPDQAALRIEPERERAETGELSSVNMSRSESPPSFFT